MLGAHKKTYRPVFVLGFACATAIATLEAACGDDDNTPAAPDASRPNAPDATGDTFVPKDSGGPDTADADECPGADASVDDAMAAQGRDFVLGYGCANCHQSTPADAGLTLEGRTTSIKPDASIYPKNLTPDRATGLGCWTNDQIVNAILNGIDDENQTLCVMPQFSKKGMDQASALAVANFLRTLPAVNHDIPESVCPAPSDAGTD